MLDATGIRTTLLTQFHTLGSASRAGKGDFAESIESLAPLTRELADTSAPTMQNLLEMQQTSTMLKQIMLAHLSSRTQSGFMRREYAHQTGLQAAFACRAAGVLDAFIFHHSGVMPVPVFADGTSEAIVAADAISLHRGVVATDLPTSRMAESKTSAMLDDLALLPQQVLDYDDRDRVFSELPAGAYMSGINAYREAFTPT
jgi:hypothetical protein